MTDDENDFYRGRKNKFCPDFFKSFLKRCSGENFIELMLKSFPTSLKIA